MLFTLLFGNGFLCFCLMAVLRDSYAVLTVCLKIPMLIYGLFKGFLRFCYRWVKGFLYASLMALFDGFFPII